jgi:DNA repair exonuclease SbcCD ATPase subunit
MRLMLCVFSMKLTGGRGRRSPWLSGEGSMKLKTIELAGFRGALPTLPIELNGKSICIYGENGYGKSTIADALELWSFGDLESFHRDRCGLDAAVHVDADEAVIVVEPEGSGCLRRTLKGSSVSAVEVIKGAADVAKVPGMPLLRHETVRDFIQKSAGEKKDELLELIGLTPLSPFRDAIRSAKTEAKRARETAKTACDREQERVSEKANGSSVVEAAEKLRQAAKLSKKITSLDDLRELELELGSQTPVPDRLNDIEKLTRALEDVAASSTSPWNELLADQEAIERKAVAALVREGRRVLSKWREDTCPLCRQDYSRERLATELEERVAELTKIEQRFNDAKTPLEEATRAWNALADAIDAILRNAPRGDWPNQSSLEGARASAREHVNALKAAGQEISPAPNAPELTLSSELKSMRDTASSQISPEQKAAVDIALLREQQLRLDEAAAELTRSQATERAVEALLKAADERIGAAIDDAIKRLSKHVAQYYLKISGSQVYSNVELRYDRRRAGGAEFSIRYDGRPTFSPPQRIMSGGQLHALALAFFLARTKLEGGHWRTMVLDDVVASFGGIHRRGLIELLVEEFNDWQIILLTHDRTFARLVLHRVESTWNHRRIAQWTPKGGPHLASGDPLQRLDELLDEGRSADELGGIGREAFEAEISKPLEPLEYLIEYHDNGRHTGMDYLKALRRGLKTAKSEIAKADVLSRLAADNFVVNLAAHDQPILSGAETADFRRLVEDLKEVRELFRCDACGEAVWAMGDKRGEHHCSCKALAA